MASSSELAAAPCMHTTHRKLNVEVVLNKNGIQPYSMKMNEKEINFTTSTLRVKFRRLSTGRVKSFGPRKQRRSMGATSPPPRLAFPVELASKSPGML